MDAYTEVRKDILDFTRAGLNSGIIQNPSIGGDFFADNSCITSRHSFFRDEEDYLNRYFYAYENREYVFTFMDGSFVQLHYEFEKIRKRTVYIKKMSLAYLPNVVDGKMVNNYIRIDYDQLTESSFFHSAAHVHIGFANNFRLPFDDVILLSEFFELISYCYYPDAYTTYKAGGMPRTYTHNREPGRLTKNTVLADEILANAYVLRKHRP
jgi:hypothetical protein